MCFAFYNILLGEFDWYNVELECNFFSAYLISILIEMDFHITYFYSSPYFNFVINAI